MRFEVDGSPCQRVVKRDSKAFPQRGIGYIPRASGSGDYMTATGCNPLWSTLLYFVPGILLLFAFIQVLTADAGALEGRWCAKGGGPRGKDLPLMLRAPAQEAVA